MSFDRNDEFLLFKNLLKADLTYSVTPDEHSILTTGIGNPINNAEKRIAMARKLGKEIKKICALYADIEPPISIKLAFLDLNSRVKTDKVLIEEYSKNPKLRRDAGGPRKYPLMASIFALHMITRFDEKTYDGQLYDFFKMNGELDIHSKGLMEDLMAKESKSRISHGKNPDKHWRSEFKDGLTKTILSYLILEKAKDKKQVATEMKTIMKDNGAEDWQKVIRLIARNFNGISFFYFDNIELHLEKLNS